MGGEVLIARESNHAEALKSCAIGALDVRAARVSRREVVIPGQKIAQPGLAAKGLRAGDKLCARYRLEHVAGMGGMATVWRAHDERLDCTVAIKVLAEPLAANAAAVASFEREARTHYAIRHPNVVRVFDYSVGTDQPYLVLDYIAGATLSERVDRGGLEPPAIHRLARELLSAVAWVHDQGVLHRDVKPGNTLIDRHGRAHVIDFGLAGPEDSDRVTHSAAIAGTLRFLAPELLEGSPSTRQTDLYALGVLLRIAAGASPAYRKVQELIIALTQPDPRARPRDARAALMQLEGRPQRVKRVARV